MNLKNTPWKIIYFLCLLDATAFAAKVNNKFFPLKRDTIYSYPFWPKNDLLQIKTSDYGEMWESKGIILDAIKGKENEFLWSKKRTLHIIDDPTRNNEGIENLTSVVFLKNYPDEIVNKYNSVNMFNLNDEIILNPLNTMRSKSTNIVQSTINNDQKHNKCQAETIEKNVTKYDPVYRYMRQKINRVSLNQSIIPYTIDSLGSLMEQKTINWDEVIANISLNALGFFLEKYPGKIADVENYNAYCNAISKKVPVDQLTSLLEAMIKRGANINQEEKIKIKPICGGCETVEGHKKEKCILVKNNQKFDPTADDIHKVYVDQGRIEIKCPILRLSNNSSKLGVFEVYNNPLWAIIKYYYDEKKTVIGEPKTNLASLMKLFIDNKADINSENILIEWFEHKRKPYNKTRQVESLLGFAVSAKVPADVIKLLVSKGAEIYRNNECNSVKIDNQTFKIHKKMSYFFLFNKLSYLNRTEKDQLIKELIEENGERWRDLPGLPVWIDSSVQNQLLWFEKAIINKIDRKITKDDIKNVCNGACSIEKDEKTEDIIKVLNCFLKILYPTNPALLKLFIKKAVAKSIKPAFLPKTIIEKIVEYCIPVKEKELVEMITGMTTVKPYLRPNQRISLYEANIAHRYKKDLKHFFSGKNPVHNTNKEEFIKENEEHWEDLLELPDWIKRAMEGRQDMRNDQDIDELKIKDVCLAAFSNSMKDKGIDNIIKGLNFFLKILLDQKYSTALSKKSDISGIEKNLPKEKLYEIEKKELVAMIKGMTTVKTYLRPNTIISLYKANRKYDYDTDLENFFNRYL